MNLKKSLQTLKEDLSKKETILKAIQQTHPQLSTLYEHQILAYFEVTSIDELDEHIKHKKESIPPDTLNTLVCQCTDSQGQPKALYDSEESAQKEATILSKQKNLNLSIYPCPHHAGWHLTKG